MIARIKLVTELYTLSEWMALRAFGGMKPEDMSVRPNDKANSFHWVFGHITASRYSLAKTLGLNENVTWGKLFDRGEEVHDASAYPSIDEIHAAFSDISLKLKGRLETLTEADLEVEPPYVITGIEKSTAGIMAFLSLHESYHVGQLAYILKLHGRTSLVG